MTGQRRRFLSPRVSLDWLTRSGRLPLATILVITLLGMALRVHRLGYKSLWYDEAMLYQISLGSPAEVLAKNASVNSAPPLFPWLLASVSVFGHTEEVLRLSPCIAGVVAIPALYALGRRFLTSGGALTAALLLAVAPIQVQYSQEVREYSFSVLMAILIMLAADRFEETPSWTRSLVLVGTAGLGIFMQYGLALLVGALDLVLSLRLFLRNGWSRGLAGRWLLLQAGIAAAAIAVYYLSLRGQWSPGGFAGTGYLSGAYWSGGSVASAAAFLVNRTRAVVDFAFPGQMFLVLVYSGVVVVLVSPEKWPRAIFIPVSFLVVATAGLARLYPYHGGRQDLFLTPLVYLTAAFGLDYLLKIDPKRALPLLFLVLIARKASEALPAYYASEGQSGVARIVEYLREVAQPGDPIYTCRDDPVFSYYLETRYPMDRNPLVVGNQDTARGPRDYLDQVDTMLAQHKRAWLLISTWCGDMIPMLDHLGAQWNVELVEEVEPDVQLFFAY